MATLLEQAAELLQNGVSFAMATIVAQDGSTPRGLGTQMLILPDFIVATVGGGGMEGDVIKIAREKVLADQKPLLRRYVMSGKDAAVSDFICGGDCDILIVYIDASNPAYKQVFDAARAAESSGNQAWLIQILDTNSDTQNPFQLCLNLSCERIVGEFSGSGHMQLKMLNTPLRIALHGEEDNRIFYYVSPIHSGGRMLLFGGGHVSREVALLAARLDFHITVIDDRAEFANPRSFPGCDAVVVDDFNQIPDLECGKDTYILIITRGHAHDKTVLEWALKQTYCYLGMIGSKTKRDNIYRRLIEDGASADQIARVHCPVGLKIGAQTPAEIAVSILAEIIQVKHPNDNAP